MLTSSALSTVNDTNNEEAVIIPRVSVQQQRRGESTTTKAGNAHKTRERGEQRKKAFRLSTKAHDGQQQDGKQINEAEDCGEEPRHALTKQEVIELRRRQKQRQFQKYVTHRFFGPRRYPRPSKYWSANREVGVSDGANAMSAKAIAQKLAETKEEACRTRDVEVPGRRGQERQQLHIGEQKENTPEPQELIVDL
jgi:hypothetical protein